MSEVLKVTGLKETQKKLFAYNEKMGSKITISALRQGAALVRRQAQANVPVRTGRLRRGFRVSRSKIHNREKSLGVFLTLKKAGGPNDPYYGRWVEKGSKHNKAIHFLDRAFEKQKRNAVTTIVRTAEAGSDSVTRRLGLR